MAGGGVNRSIVIVAAKGILACKNPTFLPENGGSLHLDRGWAQSFMKRMNLVKWKATKAARKIPPDFDSIKKDFLRRISETVKEHNIPDDLILNWDQTAVPASEWTMASCGSKQVAMIGIDDKREVTALLRITLSGVLLPPQIVYKGKTDACHPQAKFPDGWRISDTESHWSTELSMMDVSFLIDQPSPSSVTGSDTGSPQSINAVRQCWPFEYKLPTTYPESVLFALAQQANLNKPGQTAARDMSRASLYRQLSTVPCTSTHCIPIHQRKQTWPKQLSVNTHTCEMVRRMASALGTSLSVSEWVSSFLMANQHIRGNNDSLKLIYDNLRQLYVLMQLWLSQKLSQTTEASTWGNET